MTAKGSIYYLSPVFLSKMALQESHFSSIFMQINDIIEEYKLDGRDFSTVNKFRMALVNGKKDIRNGLCHIEIPLEKI